MRNLATAALILILMQGAALAGTASLPSILVPVHLSQANDPPERIAMARVTDAAGIVIGTVQTLEVRDGKPARLDVALLGSENSVSLDAATVRYDAASNVVAASQSAGQLMAHPES